MLKVLVVIPTQGKRAEMLEEALESVYGQTQFADEIVVAQSNYRETAEGVPVNDSFADRVNTAIARSDCDAFLILADDDKLDPMFIQKTVEAMERNGVDIVYTNCHIFGKRNDLGSALGEWTKENIDRNTVPLCTSLCRKSAWDKAGRYVDTAYYDWDFWWRCFYAGATAYWLKQPLFWWRDHADSGTGTINHAEERRMTLARFEQLRSVMA